MIVLRELAPAKVNLYLHVTGKRAGYHTLDSLVVFADAADKLEVMPAAELAVQCEGPFAASVSARDNSVLKAAQALRRHFNISAGVSLTLHKNLPVGAGLGGGSADAAATLRLLTRFWKLKPTPKELHALALSLGADVPACLRSNTLYLSGIGETIEPGPLLIGLHAVLVWPGKMLLTKDIFAQFKNATSTPPRHPHAFADQTAWVEYLNKAKNDLQPIAVKKLPEISAALEALSETKDCLLARMSGSGSACFGLFPNHETALSAERHLTSRHPGWWVKAASLR